MRKSAFVIVTVLALCLAQGLFAQDKMGGKKMSVQESNKKHTREAFDALNASDWSKFCTFVADNFAEHNPGPGEGPGCKGVTDFFTGFKKAFPDLKMTIQDIVASGDEVWVRSIVTGTQKGDFMGIPASGKSFKIDGYDVIKIKNGKATDHWGVLDMASMMQQIGGVPPPPKGK
ncbi:MAG TPA: ester cyclase [Bacteroidota bacterium]|nr:ester cyclase [Bacteroidota bacterium]